jgi:hypothetical protein
MRVARNECQPSAVGMPASRAPRSRGVVVVASQRLFGYAGTVSCSRSSLGDRAPHRCKCAAANADGDTLTQRAAGPRQRCATESRFSWILFVVDRTRDVAGGPNTDQRPLDALSENND